MTKRRWAGLGAAVVVVAAAVGVGFVWFGGLSHRGFGPAGGELMQPDKASRLPGTWVYQGFILLGEDHLNAVNNNLRVTFSGDGRTNYMGDSRWKVDAKGRLRLSGDKGLDEIADFFFHDGKLYIQGDSNWEEYQRL